MIKLYDSFSGLLMMVRDGQFAGDTAGSLYHFGCTPAGVAETAERYEISAEVLSSVMEMLDKAGDRVSWRTSKSIQSEEEVQRFRDTLQKARTMGAEIPEWTRNTGHRDAYWNIPAMRRFLGDSVTYAFRF